MFFCLHLKLTPVNTIKLPIIVAPLLVMGKNEFVIFPVKVAFKVNGTLLIDCQNAFIIAIYFQG